MNNYAIVAQLTAWPIFCFNFQITLVAFALNLVSSEPPATSYGVPLNSYVNNAVGNGYNNNNHHDHHEGQDPDHSEVNKSIILIFTICNLHHALNSRATDD